MRIAIESAYYRALMDLFFLPNGFWIRLPARVQCSLQIQTTFINLKGNLNGKSTEHGMKSRWSKSVGLKCIAVSWSTNRLDSGLGENIFPRNSVWLLRGKNCKNSSGRFKKKTHILNLDRFMWCWVWYIVLSLYKVASIWQETNICRSC